MARLIRRPGVRYPVLVPNRARPGACPGRRGRRARRLRLGHRALRPGEPGHHARRGAGDGRARWPLRRSRPGTAAPGLRLDGLRRSRGRARWRPHRSAGSRPGWSAFGCDTISLGDTIGVATAGQVPVVLDAVVAAGVGRDQLALHFHDTYGQALANVLAGLEAGITEFDASAGGLGGCPYRPVGHRQPGHRGPGLAARRPGYRARGRPRRPGRHQRLAGRRAGPTVPVAGRHRTEPRVSALGSARKGVSGWPRSTTSTSTGASRRRGRTSRPG